VKLYAYNINQVLPSSTGEPHEHVMTSEKQKRISWPPVGIHGEDKDRLPGT